MTGYRGFRLLLSLIGDATRSHNCSFQEVTWCASICTSNFTIHVTDLSSTRFLCIIGIAAPGQYTCRFNLDGPPQERTDAACSDTRASTGNCIHNAEQCQGVQRFVGYRSASKFLADIGLRMRVETLRRELVSEDLHAARTVSVSLLGSAAISVICSREIAWRVMTLDTERAWGAAFSEAKSFSVDYAASYRSDLNACSTRLLRAAGWDDRTCSLQLSTQLTTFQSSSPSSGFEESSSCQSHTKSSGRQQNPGVESSQQGCRVSPAAQPEPAGDRDLRDRAETAVNSTSIAEMASMTRSKECRVGRAMLYEVTLVVVMSPACICCC